MNTPLPLPAFDDLIKGLASNALEIMKKDLGDGWEKLSTSEKEDCANLLRSIAKTKALQIAGRDVSAYLPILESAFLQWKAVASLELASAMRSALHDMLSFGGTFAGAILTSFVKGMAV